jgi:hypothetical protein
VAAHGEDPQRKIREQGQHQDARNTAPQPGLAPTNDLVRLKKVDSCAAAHEQQQHNEQRIRRRITVDALRPLALVSEKLAARTNRRVSEQERRIARGCMTHCAG